MTVTPLTAQVFPTIPAQVYGRYACRFKGISVTPGWVVKIGLLPADNVLPDHGEIEYPTGDLSDDVLILFTPASPTGVPAGVSVGVQWTAWHIAVVEWKPASLKCFLDGVQVYSNAVSVPTTPMVFSIQTTGGTSSGVGIPGLSPSSGLFPSTTLWPTDTLFPGATDAHLFVDWVAAWSV